MKHIDWLDNWFYCSWALANWVFTYLAKVISLLGLSSALLRSPVLSCALLCSPVLSRAFLCSPALFGVRIPDLGGCPESVSGISEKSVWSSFRAKPRSSTQLQPQFNMLAKLIWLEVLTSYLLVHSYKKQFNVLATLIWLEALTNYLLLHNYSHSATC